MNTLPGKKIFSQKIRYSFMATATLLATTFTNFSLMEVTFAAEKSIDEKELVTILRATKIVPPDSKLTASIGGDEIVISTMKKDGATNDATKIEAVLIAKTVFDSVANDAQRTKVIFFDLNTNSYSEVAVKRAEVKLYGSGQLSEKELLSSLELKTGGVEDGSDATVTVGPGPMQIDRIMLSARLAKLEEQGSSVKDLRQLFEQLEATAKSEDKAGTAAQVKDLRLKVGDREKALSQARRHENYLDAKVQRRAQFSQNGNLQSTGGGQNQSDKGTPPHADQSNEASGIPHEWTRAYVNALLLNPVNKKPMYNFVVDDLPKPKPGSGYFALISCLIGIQNKVKSGQNVDGFVKSMNDVMSSQINHGRDYKERLHQLLGRLSQSSPAQTGADRRSPNRLPSPPY